MNHSALEILPFIWRHRKVLGGVVLLALIISTIFSFILPPKYKSVVTVYPSSSASVSKSILQERSGVKNDLLQFGEDEETERLLQVLNSDKLQKRLIQRFNLMEHYGIDTGSCQYPYFRLNQKIEKYIDFERTKYRAIKIEVLDKDPEMAAKMADYTIRSLDTLMNRIYHSRAQKAFQIVKNEYFSLKKEIQATQDTLSALSEKGIYSYEKQAEVYSEAYAQAVANGNKEGAQLLKQKLNNLGKYGGVYYTKKEFLDHETERLSDLKGQYKAMQIEAFEFMSYIFVIDEAEVPKRKASPKRLLIIVSTTIIAFIVALLLLVILHRIKQLRFTYD